MTAGRWPMEIRVMVGHRSSKPDNISGFVYERDQKRPARGVDPGQAVSGDFSAAKRDSGSAVAAAAVTAAPAVAHPAAHVAAAHVASAEAAHVAASAEATDVAAAEASHVRD